jgi:signal transduction histidine kinase
MLEQANATKDRFFSIISHDLRNAMNSLTNIASIFEDYYESMTREQITKNIGSFIKSTSNTSKLLENLLSWARANTGGITFNPAKYEIKNIADKTFADVGAQAQNKGIKLIFENKASTDFVHCDSDMVNTILRNLISNAIKFSASEKKISVIIDNYSEDNKYIVFSVKDQGVGMSQETIDKLFRIDTKISTKGTSGEAGTGLGLILCKEFIDKHNCNI